jgi:hypothetical protein
MRIKQIFRTYNALIYLRAECSERKLRRGPNQIWLKNGAPNSIRIAICGPNQQKIRKVLVFWLEQYERKAPNNSVRIA